MSLGLPFCGFKMVYNELNTLNLIDKKNALLNWYKERGLVFVASQKKKSSSETPAPSKKYKAIFIENSHEDLFLKEPGLKQECITLFSKIREAMRLTADDYCLIRPEELSKSFFETEPTGCFIILGKTAQDFLASNYGSNCPISFGKWFSLNNVAGSFIATHHPVELLKNPSNKKSAWDHFQLAMKKFNNG